MSLLSSPNTTFTISFTLEVLDSGIWEDHKEGLIELERSIRIIKFGYTLYMNLFFYVDVEIWPQAAKITSGDKHCWVRTWQFLERRWLSFSIKHEIPVLVRDMMLFTANVTFTVNIGGSSTPVIGFPPLPFGVRRYFGPVDEKEARPDLPTAIKGWLCAALEEIFPILNEPGPVTDIRHQDKLLYIVQDLTLNPPPKEDVESVTLVIETKSRKLTKDKIIAPQMKSYDVSLSGDVILAGVGRVVPFEIAGDLPPGMGDMVILLSTSNLPAPNDDPVIFVNIDKLFDAPLPELRKLGITHLYTRWSIGEEVHDSEHFDIVKLKKTELTFNDHHAVPLEPLKVSETTAAFLDGYFRIEVRGIKENKQHNGKPTLFGYDKADREYDFKTPKIAKNEPTDFVVAKTKIDAKSLAKGLNAFINGEYPLYPIRPSVSPISRDKKCSNDVNLIGVPLQPEIVVPVSLVLAAQMNLEVSMGIVGCKPPILMPSFSRLYCLISDTLGAMAIIAEIRTINEELAITKLEAMLTGFAVDTGNVVVLFLEGPRDGSILKVWELSEEFHPKIKPVFNSSARYPNRIYEEFLKELAPFIVLKTYVPLEVLLACPAIYVRPALPNPARLAALKFGRLIQCRFRSMPYRNELPSVAELRSFRLEICAPLRSVPPATESHYSETMMPEKSAESMRKRVDIDESNPVLPYRITFE